MKNSLLLLSFFLFLTSCGGDGVPSKGTPSPTGSTGNNNQTAISPPNCLVTVMGNSRMSFDDKKDFFEQIRRISKQCTQENELKELKTFFSERLNTNKDYFKDVEILFNLKGE
ncbi:MAG: hypothetical protein NXH75_06575 [Halobacteriovoraceae bacterium]|nr:hypothetical protein [Halobacteriovoraceae bacterium]